MTKPRLLVVTSVHQPDDARIRSKLIPTLAREWDVSYATRSPGPADATDLHWIPLTGGRMRRSLHASRIILASGWDLVAIHDPELLPAGLVRSRRRQPTLFDLHENLPSQLRTRAGIPAIFRRPLAAVSRWVLKMAEATMAITLAEEGYQSLFAAQHPVISNHLPDDMPQPQPAASPPFLAYLGDVTELRGAFLALEAAAGAGCGLQMVGRVAPPQLAEELHRRAADLGVELDLGGPLPHGEALQRVAPALAGLSPLLDVGNYRHSLPTKVPEYLALGLPVLAADLPGTRLPVEGLKGVTFVEPGDPHSWREAGRRLASDPGSREELAGQAAEVRRRFAWPTDEVLSVYRRAARR